MSDDETREDPEVAQTYFHQQVVLAQAHHDRGLHFAYAHPQNIDKALEELDHAIQLRESIFGKFHNDTGLSYFRKADLLREKRENTQALVTARRELRITHRLLGGDNSETPVGGTDSGQWWLLERIQWIEEVLLKHNLQKISQHEITMYSSALLKAMECERLGGLHFTAGDYDLALDEYDSALGIEVSARDHNPIEVADLHVKIGDCFAAMKEYDAAHQEYDNAERKYLSTLGIAFRVLGQLYQSKGSIFLKQQKFDDALRNYAKAYSVFEQTLGKEHELSIEILQDIRLVTVKEMEELRNMERLRQKNSNKSLILSRRRKESCVQSGWDE